MWEGVTPVAQGYDPIVGESPEPLKFVVFNAGPGTVLLRSWDHRAPGLEAPPDASMELRPGATRVVLGNLVRISLKNDAPHPTALGQPNFAAVGWRTHAPYAELVKA